MTWKDYESCLDLMMPDVDGFSIEELKKSENSPIAIVLTAYASIDRVMLRR
jgi:CheY-like chemotaxis protein